MPNVTLNSKIYVLDNVEGVDQWMIEQSVNSGVYSELTAINPDSGFSYSDVSNEIFYNCPYTTVGSGDTERRDYNFNFAYTVPEILSIGDVFKFRFTPSGWDLGNGDPFESAEYSIIEFNNNLRRRRLLPVFMQLGKR